MSLIELAEENQLPAVLIIDDEKDNLDAMKRLLRLEFNVHATASATEALKWLKTKEFAVIISDQRMPEITGVELLEKVRAMHPDTIRILLTGYTDLESVIGAINRGHIYRYIAKPWDPKDLKITLKRASEAFELTKKIQHKNQELQSKNLQLENALIELRSLDKAKARFLTIISHELNTPLTAIASFTALLQEEASQLTEASQKALSHLKGAADRLGEIIEDVLVYIRLEADTDWAGQDFDWDKEVMDQIQALAPYRQERQIALRLRSKGKPHSNVNTSKMRMLLSRLLKDAVLRAEEKKEVIVTLSVTDKGVSMKLSGPGQALAEENLELFEPSINLLHHKRNLGLALPIAKLIAEKHHAEFRILHAPEGEWGLELLLPRG